MLCATRRYSNRFSSKICRQRSLPRRRNVYHQMRQIDLTGLCKYKPHFQKENNIIYFFCLTSTSCNTRRVAAKDLGLSTFPYDHLSKQVPPWSIRCYVQNYRQATSSFKRGPAFADEVRLLQTHGLMVILGRTEILSYIGK